MTIRIGLLGAGAMGAEHAWCYGQMDGVELAGVYSRDPEKATAIAQPSGARVRAAARDLIDDPAVDAIDVCLTTAVHADHVVAALQAGKHVFCETPLATEMAEAARMRDAARGSGKLLQVGLLMRSVAACQWVRAAVEDGRYGRLVSLTAHRLGSYLRADSPDHKPHYSDPTTELMTFDLDFVGWVMGAPAEVVARAAAWGDGIGEATAMLRYDDGRLASVLASGILPSGAAFATGFRAVFEQALAEAETLIDAGGITSRFRLYAEGGATEPELPQHNPYQLELERFRDCILGAADPGLLDVERAIEALSLSLAVQASLERSPSA